MRKMYNLSTKQTMTSLTYDLAYKKQNCKSYSKFWIQILDTLLQAHDHNLE